jgi:hypothetical protein
VRIVVGSANFDSFTWTIGARVFARDFDSDYLIDNPGYNALSSTSPFLPDGYFALPASSPIGWDFLPMTVGSDVANLMYWNGQDENSNGVDVLDVAFAPLPGANLSLAGAGGTAVADGSTQLIMGSTLVTTDSTGGLHSHRNYWLDDGDMNGSTNPVDGIYLVALQLRMAVLATSDPFFLVFGTPGSTLAARNSAVAWAEERVDSLVVLGLPGDYNDDYIVDAGDYTVWRDSLNMAIALPNEAASPNVVDSADYDVWKSHFGQSASETAGIAVLSVPEPSTFACAMVACMVALSLAIGQLRRSRRGLGSVPPPR